MIKFERMKVIIVGAGASGIASAISYKRNHPNDDVLIVEHTDKPLKKILATGNGKCNLGNSNINFNAYSKPDFVKKIALDYDYIKFFESISIKTKTIDNLAYPVSESAVSVREALLKETAKLGIKISIEDKLISYKMGSIIEVTTSKSVYKCDKLILSSGGKSSPKLGSDGSVLDILKHHNYKIIEPIPGLCPLFTLEKTKSLDGVRVKANVKLVSENKVIHEEKGEVLFKEHGLSGIVIFNTMSLIARNISKKYKIVLDLLPDYSDAELRNYLCSHSYEELMLAYINPKIASYLKERFKNNSEIINHIKNLEFDFDKSYGFDYSQISVGGVSIENVDEKLMSKFENNVYITGELLDVDGPCGGYNLTWAFASGLFVGKNI